MTNITALPNRRAADTWRYLDELGYSVDPLTGDAYGPEPEHPDVTRVRRENLALVGATPNPAPTLSPEAMRRVRHDLQAGRQTSHEPDGPSAA